MLTPHLELQQIGITEKPKSKGKAFFLSLLLPGLGERYVGSNTKSQIFVGTEVLLWLGYAGFNRYSAWRKEDYFRKSRAVAAIGF